ncbi:hypothetical protein PACILC2_21160 [Paenibacillus cisolokensis]|uniref:Uncharacterized protein n=1 Tax=Paenibacillus cisolokensis TaxID=1658519 RepID=A0ABQ4N5Q4_9BACL|nr:hypothetical protein PACILC2_21160 [Paenibacillus cisolokensis]
MSANLTERNGEDMALSKRIEDAIISGANVRGTKFPVTYCGVQYRVSVAEGETDFFGEPCHRVKVYEVKNGLFRKFVKVAEYQINSNRDSEWDVIASAMTAVKRYVNQRQRHEKERKLGELSRNGTGR